MLRLAFIHIFGHGHGKIKIGFTGILNSGLAGDNTTYKKKKTITASPLFGCINSKTLVDITLHSSKISNADKF